jgi:hypothetical protein
MTIEKYRKNLTAWIENFRLSESINNNSKFIDIEFLTKCLTNAKFNKEASVEDLYKFRGEIFKLYSKTKHIVSEIENRDLLFTGQFEDKIMNFEELGIKTKTFECIVAFEDDFSMLNILPGTVFEVDELLYANVSNMVTGSYRELITDSNSKLKEYFESGESAILNLKILEECFKPKD